MANCCCCEVIVSGEAAKLKEFWERLKAQDPQIVERNIWLEAHNGIYCASLDQAVVTDDSICFSMDTKWEPKLAEMASVSALFPELTFEVRYEEPGMGIYGSAIIKDGEFEDTPMEPLEYHLQYNHELRDQALFLLDPKTPWEDCKEIMESDDMEYGAHRYLEALAVKRIPVEELPLYVSHTWCNEEAEEMYKARLAGKYKKSAIEEALSEADSDS